MQLIPSSFGHLPSLRSLYLGECDWSECGEHAFDSLPNLEALKIYNPINFDHVNLSELVSLKELAIQRILANKMYEMLDTVNVVNLSMLSIAYPKGTMRIDELLQVIRPFKKLEDLSLSQIEIDEFDIDWFASFACLKCLSVNYCEIKTIKLSSKSEAACPKIESIRFARLEKLNLGNNFIFQVDREIFREFPCLKLLNLYCNKLTCLPDDVFVDLVNLEELWIMGNRITELSPVTFAGLVKLRNLNIAYNPFESIEPSTFAPMTNLEEIYVEDTYFENRDTLEEIYKEKIKF